MLTLQSEYTPVSYNMYLLSHIRCMRIPLCVLYGTCLMCIASGVVTLQSECTAGERVGWKGCSQTPQKSYSFVIHCELQKNRTLSRMRQVSRHALCVTGCKVSIPRRKSGWMRRTKSVSYGIWRTFVAIDVSMAKDWLEMIVVSWLWKWLWFDCAPNDARTYLYLWWKSGWKEWLVRQMPHEHKWRTNIFPNRAKSFGAPNAARTYFVPPNDARNMYLWQHTAAHCSTLQHTATHCNTLRHIATHDTHCSTLQCTATRCNALQHTATHKIKTCCNELYETCLTCDRVQSKYTRGDGVAGIVTRSDTLQHTKTHCNTRQHTAAHVRQGTK